MKYDAIQLANTLYLVITKKKLLKVRFGIGEKLKAIKLKPGEKLIPLAPV